MFVGTFEHSLDDKGRLILPTAFRESFGAGAYLTQSIDGCLALMSESTFVETAERLKVMSQAGPLARHQFRVFAAGSTQVVPDRQGRIGVSVSQRDFAAIEKACIINGAYDHVEIWSSDRWAVAEAQGRDELIAGDVTGTNLRLMIDNERRS